MRNPERACVFVVAACLFGARDASAFCRTTTVDIDPTFVSTPDAPCWTEGKPLFWKSACVGYSIQRDASRQVSLDDAELAMETAFAQWTNASPSSASSDAAAGKASVDVRFLGPVACHRVEYNAGSGNANIIMFDDDAWPHHDAKSTLGLTKVWYVPDTGELVDSDMEINSHAVTLTVSGDVPQDGYDLLSIVTHEAGHFLGLAHSPNARATMFASYAQGSTSMRSLSSDDVAGICATYPPGRNAVCDPTPRHGYAETCSGCSMRPGTGEGSDAVAALAAICSVLAVRRRR